MIIVANDAKELQRIITPLEEGMNEYEMKTTEKKTKIMWLNYIETRKSAKG